MHLVHLMTLRPIVSALSSRLHRTLNMDMIRPALTDRIIGLYISSVQRLSGEVTVGLISYILSVLGGFSESYLSVVSGGCWISYLAEFGRGISESYLVLVLVFVGVGVVVQSEMSEFADDDGKGGGEEGAMVERQGDIYTRVSSYEQAKTGRSLESQVSELKELAEEMGVSLVRSPIKDDGESGMNFDRDGIKQVFRDASEDRITFLFVDDVDRIGRNAPKTIYFIYVLRTEFEVTIVTPSGTLDPTTTNGLMELTLKAVMAHIETDSRSQSSMRSCVDRFLKEKQWGTWFQNIPVGYSENDGGWLEVEPREVEIAEELFEYFVEVESYAPTRRHLNNKYEDVLNDSLSKYEVKSWLQNPVYVGKPTIPVDSAREDEEEEEASVTDAELQIIDEELFERAQQVVDRIARANETDEEVKDVDDFIAMFGLFPVVESSPIVKLVCPNCGSEMDKNGQRDLDGDLKVHNYICTNEECGEDRTSPRQRKFPYLREYEKMQRLSEE